jgi:hypothetical protein
MRIASLLTLSAVLVSAGASAAPSTRAASSSIAPQQIRVADAAQAPRSSAVAPIAPVTTAVVPKKICKMLPSSYSHTQQRVCLTKDEWKQVDEQSRD